MALKWEEPCPDEQEICRETENEVTWNIDIEQGDDVQNLELVLCYTEIVGGDKYATKVKANDKVVEKDDLPDIEDAIIMAISEMMDASNIADCAASLSEMVENWCADNDCLYG